MSFVSEGKGLGATFFFELPVYSAAFAGKERQEKETGAGTNDQIPFPVNANDSGAGTNDQIPFPVHANDSFFKPMSVSPKSSRSNRVYVTDSPSIACDLNSEDEFRPSFFNTGLSQESDSFPFAHSLGY